MRFSLLMTYGRFNIRFLASDQVILDRLFNLTSHHLWSSRRVTKGSWVQEFHLDLFTAGTEALLECMKRADFGYAVDPGTQSLDQLKTWLTPKISPILNGELFQNMLPDVRFLPGTNHEDDRILLPTTSVTTGRRLAH